MTGKTHAAVGTLCALPFVDMNNAETLILIPVALFSSLLPDLESDYCLLRTIKYTAFFIFSAVIFLIFHGTSVSLISFIALLIFSYRVKNNEHRSLLHSLSGMFLYCVFVALISLRFVPVFLLGYGSHLLLDSLTIAGIPLMYPRLKRYGLRKVTYNGKFNKYLRGLCRITTWSLIARALISLW